VLQGLRPCIKGSTLTRALAPQVLEGLKPKFFRGTTSGRTAYASYRGTSFRRAVSSFDYANSTA